MKMSLAVIAAAAISICTLVQAADNQGRIDVFGDKDGITLSDLKSEGGGVMNAGWLKEPEKRTQVVVAIFPAVPEWKSGTFSFTPSKDGEVTVYIRGAWNADGTQTWTLFDDIQVKGAEIKNGGFEEDAANWILGEKTSLSDNAKSGKKSIKVAHDFPANQNIKVKGGQPVTVSFWYKSAE